MIGIVDYGAGNLGSVENALAALGLPARRCATPADVGAVDRLVLPGVGHFGAAMRHLRQRGLDAAVGEAAAAGAPVLGICLGMQLLFAGSAEAPEMAGLGLLPGRCERLTSRRVPHIGWNRVQWRAGPACPADGHAYFAHSFHVVGAAVADVWATTELDALEVVAACGRGALRGCQFHPEKSGRLGLQWLAEWLRC